MKDKNGKEIKLGFTALVPDPIQGAPYFDPYNHSFVGTISGFHGEYVVVEDGDGNCLCIEPDRIELDFE